jgi:hypothetical protein
MRARGIFFATGLDNPNHVDFTQQIRLSALNKRGLFLSAAAFGRQLRALCPFAEKCFRLLQHKLNGFIG